MCVCAFICVFVHRYVCVSVILGNVEYVRDITGRCVSMCAYVPACVSEGG